ncbi:MAG: hypothetical protein LRY66_09335 [Saccharospirillaceae bacterium]|nr:hypothetical protein [Saccharospirillaceae bacterium]MCD8531546.1 hypothetical protein [Saccharospirillaceae bacterium]
MPGDYEGFMQKPLSGGLFLRRMANRGCPVPIRAIKLALANLHICRGSLLICADILSAFSPEKNNKQESL